MTAENKYYTKEHQWISFIDGIAQIGVTPYGLKDMGNLILVELPSVNEEVSKEDEIAFLEGAKSTLSLQSPFDGIIVLINQELLDRPEILNDQAETTFIVAICNNEGYDPSGFLNSDAYAAYLADL